MSKKWMKVDPATLKVGDEVRWIVEITGGRVIREVAVREIAPDGIRLGMTWAAQAQGTWYVRKSKKAKPVMPERAGVLRVTIHKGGGWIDPATIRVGDRVEYISTVKTTVTRTEFTVTWHDLDDAVLHSKHESCYYGHGEFKWFLLLRPEPVMPEEPPVGTFFRVDRTGFEFWRFSSMEDGYGYWQISPRSEEPDWERWDDITEPGDTITRLLLVEATDD